MKKNNIVYVFLVSFFYFFSAFSFTLDDLQRLLEPVLEQTYDPQKYTWDFAYFEDIYLNNNSFYAKRSYITSKKIFLSLFKEEKNKKKVSSSAVENLIIPCSKDQKCIVVGSLYGGVQCLFDYIKNWYHEGFLTKDLLLKENYYVIFLGNFIGRSPYSLETVAVIKMLMQKNPNKIFCMLGFQEYQDAWVDFALGDEIVAMDRLPLYKPLISAFFAQCPVAISLKYDNAAKKTILCVPSHYNAIKYVTRDTFVILQGIYDEFVIRNNNSGLFMEPPINGATHWTVFSAPTPFMKEYYNFSTYSYVLLDEKTITHVYRTENQTQYQKETFDIFTGLKV